MKTIGLSQEELEAVLIDDINGNAIVSAAGIRSAIAKAIVANNQKILKDLDGEVNQFMRDLKQQNQMR